MHRQVTAQLNEPSGASHQQLVIEGVKSDWLVPVHSARMKLGCARATCAVAHCLLQYRTSPVVSSPTIRVCLDGI